MIYLGLNISYKKNMIFRTSSHTNKGGRANNEDYHMYSNGIWILADGLGGHGYGEVASKNVCDNLLTLLRENQGKLEKKEIIESVQKANQLLMEKQKERDEYKSMRTTLVLAVTNGMSLNFINVGDSRLYYFRKGEILCQTEDHSVSAASVRLGEMEYSQIRKDEDRNLLLKVMGENETLNIENSFHSIDIMPDDAFLLCSDGFWEYVFEQEMMIDLLKSKTPEEWLNYMFKRVLTKSMNENNDNFTAICVMVGE